MNCPKCKRKMEVISKGENEKMVWRDYHCICGAMEYVEKEK